MEKDNPSGEVWYNLPCIIWLDLSHSYSTDIKAFRLFTEICQHFYLM